MTEFEYKLVPTPKGPQSPSAIVQILNAYGREGWELVELDYGCYILKRQAMRESDGGTK